MVNMQVRVLAPALHHGRNKPLKHSFLCCSVKRPERFVIRFSAWSRGDRNDPKEIFQPMIESVGVRFNVKEDISWRWSRQGRKAFLCLNRLQQLINRPTRLPPRYLQARLFSNAQQGCVSNALNLWFDGQDELGEARDCVNITLHQYLPLIPRDSGDQ